MSLTYDKLNNLHEYNISDDPSSKIKNWRFPKLYKLDMRGEEREWFAAFYNGGIVSSHGTVNGEKIISEPYEVTENNSGRSIVEQAALEIRYRYEVKMRKEGYRFHGELRELNAKPMLAEDWLKRRKSTVLYFPVAIQPKLDGIRCLVKEDPATGNILYRSRTNKPYNFGYLFDEEIKVLLSFFPFPVELDGELYIHGELLQKISSIVSLKIMPNELDKAPKHKREEYAETLELREKYLKYNIFTVITPKDLPYEDRQELLFKAYKSTYNYFKNKYPKDYNNNVLNKIVMVKDQIVNSYEELDEYLEYYTSKLGYEGIMIYKLGVSLPKDKIKESYYRHGRSWNLIKYKTFFDEEFKIISVKSGKGKAAVLAGLRLEDNKDSNIIHEVNIADNDEVRKHILDNPKLVIGKMATVKHYGRTEDNKLRHASVISIRDYE